MPNRINPRVYFGRAKHMKKDEKLSFKEQRNAHRNAAGSAAVTTSENEKA